MQPKFDQNKINDGYDGIVKKPSHATVPLKGPGHEIVLGLMRTSAGF
jgi:hypothetical protein